MPAAGRLQIGTLWTQGLKLSSVFEGMRLLGLVNDTPNSCFRKIFRGPRTMLRLRRAAYKLELYGHRDSNLVRFLRGWVHWDLLKF